MEDPVSVLQPADSCHPAARPPPVRQAIQTMLDPQHRRGAGRRDADGKLLGIFSERDLLTKVAGLHEDFTGRCRSRSS